MSKALASILLLFTACGDVVKHLPDGPPGGDGGPDTSTVDAAPNVVEVTTYSPDGVRRPNAGIRVIFTEPGGAQHVVLSDLEGRAVAEVPDGSSVTAMWLSMENQYQLETVLDVGPGDKIIMAGTSLGYQTAGTNTISFPAAPNATYYYVYNACGSNYTTTTTATAFLYEHCISPTFTASVAAYGPSGFIGYLEKPNVAYEEGGTVNLTGAYKQVQNFNATFTGLDPTAVPYVQFNRWSGPRGFSRGDGFSVTGPTGQVSLDTTTSDQAYVTTRISNSNSEQRIMQKVNGSSLVYSLDVGANMFLWLNYPQLDPATRTISIVTEGTRQPDAISMQVTYQRANATGTYVNWIVIGPTFDGGITLPNIPMTLADVNVAPGDFVYTGRALAVESEGIAGYDTVKPDFYGVFYRGADDFQHVSDQILRLAETYFD